VIAAARPTLDFVEDDYPKALATARSLGKPLFVDAWAPWCHTCLSMRAYVFPDEAMRPLATDFVWLALDTEKPESAAFLEKYKMQVWPTLWVIDPKTEAPVLKWLGSATAKELVGILQDTKAGVTNGDSQGEAGAALVRGHQASAAGKREDAVREYKAALAAAPPHWNKRAAAVEALVSRLDELRLDAECTETALAEMAKIPPGTSLANVGLLGLGCARRSPEGTPQRKSAPLLARAVEQIALDEGVPILADDRSGLFEETVDARREDHDTAGAKALAARWADFLERQARAAANPSARAVFDAHRMLAYLALGDPARAVPMLTESEKDFPKDYNPPARLAKVYLELGRFDDGVRTIERAMLLAYGPRKMRFFLLKADLLVAKGDKPGSLVALQEAVAYGASLPMAERPTRDLAEIEKRISTLRAQ
jgi:tetratricopeptide (TPR) repeat protein/thiol-disulfide isomerase/thioredoxin